MTEITREWVVDRLEEAAATERRMASPKPRGAGSAWPDMIHETTEHCDCCPIETRNGPPTSAEVIRLDECQEWLKCLGKDDRKIIWARANKAPWKVISREAHCCRATANNRWTAAIRCICAVVASARKKSV